MISIFLLFLILAVYSDTKFLEKKYEGFINVFGGLFCFVFLFVSDSMLPSLIQTTTFDKYILVFYMAIKATFSLANLVNNQTPLKVGLPEYFVLLAFSINSPIFKGLFLLLLCTRHFCFYEDEFKVSKIDLMILIALFLGQYGSDHIKVLTSILVVCIFPYYFFVGRRKINEVKLLFLLSGLVSVNGIDYPASILFVLVILFSQISRYMQEELKQKSTSFLKNIYFFEKLRLNILLRIKPVFHWDSDISIDKGFNREIKKREPLIIEPKVISTSYLGGFLLFGLVLIFLLMEVLNYV